MFQSMLFQGMEFHDQEKNRTSILLRKLSEIAPYCTGLTTGNLSHFCRCLGGILFVVVFTLIYCPKLCIVFIVYTILVITNTVLQEKLHINRIQKKIFSTGNEKLLFNEIIENIKYVTSYELGNHLGKIFKFTVNKKLKCSLAFLHLKAVIFSFNYSMEFLLQAILFTYGTDLVIYEECSVVNLFEFYALLGFTKLLITDVYAELPEHEQGKNAAKTVFKIINRKPEIDALSEEGIRLESFKANIEFRNVEFSYPSRPDEKVLNGFNLKVASGQVNALVGKSGCGKSTICSLLLRFYDVTGGVILLDGKDIKSCNVQWLRSQIGVVPRDPDLFEMTIEENILNVDRDNVNNFSTKDYF